MKNKLHTLSMNSTHCKNLNGFMVLLGEQCLRSSRIYFRVLIILMVMLGLAACGGGSGGDGKGSGKESPAPVPSASPQSTSTPEPSTSPAPTQSPIPSGDKSSLLVTVQNLKGSYTLQWKTQVLRLNPNKSSGSLRSSDDTATEMADISRSEPQFQMCSNYRLNSSGTEASLIINCREPSAHRLLVSTTGLRSPLTVNWWQESTQLNAQKSSDTLTTNTADFIQPSFEQPEHQECEAELSNIDTSPANYTIHCQDKLAKVRVSPSGRIPLGLKIAVGEQVLPVADDSVLFTEQVSRFIQPVISSEADPSIRCGLTQQGYDEASNEMQWQLSCHAYALLEHPKRGDKPAGVYIHLDSGEEQLLAEGKGILDRPIGVFAAGSATLVFNQLFGAKQLHQSSEGIYSWTHVAGLPEGDGLHTRYGDAWQSADALYLLLIEELTTHSIYRIDRQLNVRLIASNAALYGEGYTKALFMPISYHRDEVAVELRKNVAAGDDQSQIKVYKQGTIVADWDREGDRLNVGQAFPFNSVYGFFTENKQHAEADKRTDFNLVSLNVDNPDDPDPVLGQYDTNISVATWQDGEQVRTWFAGDGISLGSTKRNQLGELRDGGQEIEEVSDFIDQNISAIATSANLTLLMAQETQVAALYTNQGRVDLAQLGASLNVDTSLIRTQFYTFNLGGDWSNNLFRQPFGFVNGWLLVYSGSDEQGTIWLTNGHAQDSHIISRNSTIAQFYKYRLIFASKAMAALVVDDETDETVIIKR